jgi:predicted nucleotidyltransferase
MEKERLKTVLEDLQRTTTPKDFLFSSEKLRRKIKTGKAFKTLNELDFENIRESVLDPVNKERCPEIFDKNEEIKESTQTFILEIIKDFKNSLDFDFNIEDVWLIGSSTGFQYSFTSDIDVALITDISKKMLGKILNLIPKGLMLPETQKPVNVFLTFKNEEYDKQKAENIYDIKNKKWIKKTEGKNIKLPYSYIADLSKFFMNGCDLSISQYERDKKEYEEYQKLDPKTQEITENEKAEALDKKLLDLRNDIDSIRLAHHVIFSFEKEGYEE